MEAAAERTGRTLRISECFVHYPPLELAKKLVADGAIGKPTSLRIRTLVGPDRLGLPGRACGPRATAGASTSAARADTSSTTWCTSTRWRCGCSTSTSPRCRPWCGAATSSSSRALCIFEYEDPEVLGMMEVQYSPNFYMRSQYYGADEFFEITGDEGQIWVTRATGEMLDLAPVMLFTGTPQRAQDDRVHRPRRRLGRRLRALVPALRRRADRRAPRPP